jgi:carboxyl-terminal processing protease
MFPSMFDPDEIGESALDYALNWDQINPVRHRSYGDIAAIVPDLTRLLALRSAKNPDFVYLEDQVDLAEQVRGIKTLPLNQKTRVAMRDEQERKALVIENRRRAAQGKELLTSLEADETLDEEPLQEDEDIPDVLLTEAGQILVDALRLGGQSIAQHTPAPVVEN